MYTKKIMYSFLVLSSLTLVGCGGGSGSTDSTTPVDNIPPVANAGPDLNAQIDQTITISGSATDSDGDHCLLCLEQWYYSTSLYSLV